MGVDYQYYLIPEPQPFLPEMSQLVSFLKDAEVGGWLRPRYPGWIAKRADGKKTRREAIKLEDAASALRDQWQSGVRVGWRLWRRDDDIPYDLEIHVSPQEYVYHLSEAVSSFGESVNCIQCGTRLDHEPETHMFGVDAIHATCPRCGAFFDPSHLPAIYTHGWTGAQSELLGGLTYRFALLIDNVPPEEWEHFGVDQEFTVLCAREFGCNLHGVADVS